MFNEGDVDAEPVDRTAIDDDWRRSPALPRDWRLRPSDWRLRSRARSAVWANGVPVGPDESVAPDPTVATAHAESSTPRVRILVIDDDAEFRDSLADALQSLGYQTSVALDGPSGVAEFRRLRPDLILLDMNLHDRHGLEGIEVCRELKKLMTSWLPIMFVTGMADSATKIRALEAGGDDFLAKPFTLDVLGAQVRLLLRTVTREEGLKSETQRFRAISLTDELTGLGNRRALDRELTRSWAASARTERPLAVIMADVDNFKDFNDRHGHSAGDAVLTAVGRAIVNTIRESDSGFRYGGEEFVVILPDATRGGALLVAERVRRAVAKTAITWAGSAEPLSVTVSLGVALAPSSAVATPVALLEAADAAMYRAKRNGRNCVVVA